MNRDSLISILWALICAGLALALTPKVDARPRGYYDLQPSRNVSDAPLPTRAEYLIKFPERRYRLFSVVHLDRRNIFRRDEEGTVVLAVNHRLLEAHQEGFRVLADDLTAEGWDVVLMDFDGGTAQEVKDAVIEAGGGELKGVIFAGETPLAWFEQLEYFQNEHEPDNDRLAEFPIDLFFTDVDGVWRDDDNNGLYDCHEGDWRPELWLGRIAAYNLFHVNEDEVVTDYLDRIHRYRQGEFRRLHRALAFIDDEWAAASELWSDDERLAVGKVFTVAEAESTNATAYKERLEGEEGYELIQVAVHSTSDSHAFLINQRQNYDYFRFRHLRDETTPQCFFFNLFACSGMNLSSNLCMGALYSLKGPFGLGAVGTTKTGGMLYFNDFYRPLGEGASFGESLRRWMVQHGREEGHEHWAQSWFYGMTYFGDPTLKLSRGLRIERSEIDASSGDGDANADAGESPALLITPINFSLESFHNIHATLTSLDTLVNLVDSEYEFGDAAAGGEGSQGSFRMNIHPAVQDGQWTRFELQMNTEEGDVWWDRVFLRLCSPHFSIIEFRFDSPVSIGYIAPADTGQALFSLLNEGGDDLRELATLHIWSLDGLLKFLDPTDSIPVENLAAGEAARIGPLACSISNEAVSGAGVLIGYQIEQDGIPRGEGRALLPTAAIVRFVEPFSASPVWFHHYAVSPDYADVWIWREGAGEEGGAISFGGPDTLSYPPMADAAVELPLMALDAGALMVLRHKFNLESSYDAAVVEVNSGGGWRRATPRAGYNGFSVDNGSFTGGHCWNGSSDWRSDTLDLSEIPGALRVRLRFASDEGVELTGWRIDHLEVYGIPLFKRLEPPAPVDNALVDVYPNPFNGRAVVRVRGDELMKFELYNLQGRRIMVYPAAANGGVEEPGTAYQIDMSDLTAGVYFLRWSGLRHRGVVKVALVR